MKKIKFFSSYCSEDQIYNNIISAWSKGQTTYKDLFITKENDYEYAVIFNLALPNKEIPKSNVIGFSHEPRMTLGLNNEIIRSIDEKASKYFISNAQGLPEAFRSGYTFVLPSEFLKGETEEYPHENRMSMILSLSNFMPGHNMRHAILKEVLETDMDIHFYAEGLSSIYSDPRVKEFNWGLFNVPYENYQTQIVIENTVDDMWSTEKLSNCIIKETLPLYYGSKGISDLFYGEDKIPMLSQNLEKNMEIIKDVYYNYNRDKVSVLKEAKNKLYSEINLMEFLYQNFK
jgi:hypothetical protein